jgi:hypothetical protein
MEMTINTKDNRIGTALYIPNEFEFYEFVQESAAAVEECVGEELHWFQANRASGFRVRLSVDDPFDDSKLEEFAEWYADHLQRILTCITPYVNEYRAS